MQGVKAVSSFTPIRKTSSFLVHQPYSATTSNILIRPCSLRKTALVSTCIKGEAATIYYGRALIRFCISCRIKVREDSVRSTALQPQSYNKRSSCRWTILQLSNQKSAERENGVKISIYKFGGFFLHLKIGRQRHEFAEPLLRLVSPRMKAKNTTSLIVMQKGLSDSSCSYGILILALR